MTLQDMEHHLVASEQRLRALDALVAALERGMADRLAALEQAIDRQDEWTQDVMRAIVTLETTLGVMPQGACESVGARLADLERALAASRPGAG